MKFIIDFTTTKLPTTNRQSSSSTSSSTSSSIDEALIQLSQQQKQQAHVPTVNKLLYDESLSIFNYPPSQSKTATVNKEQCAVQDNLNFLASMAAAATTSEPSWQQTTLHSNINPKHKMQSMTLEKQAVLPKSPSTNPSSNMHELMENLNELCYRGFDELNALMQEQRWVKNQSSFIENSYSIDFNEIF